MTVRDWRAFIRTHLPAIDDAHEAEIVDELAQHLADLFAESIAEGLPPADAEARVMAALIDERNRLARDVASARRTLPAVITDRWLDAPAATPPASRLQRLFGGARQDVVHALRALWRAPGYTAVALVTLALGIGVNAAMFAAVDTLLLRPMPYADAGRLVVPVSVHVARDVDTGSVSFADYTDWARETEIFEAVALWRPIQVDLAGIGEPQRIDALQVSPEYFDVVRATPLLGRTLTSADHSADAPRATVISYALWQRILGGAADAVGRSIRIGGVPYEIAGVLPPHVVWPDNAALFVPLPARMSEDVRTRRDNLIFQVIARLREGVPIERGTAVLATIAQRLERDHPESRAGWTNRLRPLREFMVERDAARALWVLLAAVAAVLLIACANLAHLGLVRGLARSRELAIRIALGASRWRLVRQVTAECLLLGVAGAAAGAAVAAWTIPALASMAPAGTPFIDQLALDARVLAGTIALATIAVLLAGVVPALVTARVQPGSALKDGSPSAGSSRRVRVFRQALVVAEVAGAVVLLIGAALLLRSFWRLQQADPGVDVDRVLTARIVLPGAARYENPEQRAQFFDQLMDRLRAVPGVAAAGATSFVPIGGGGFGLGRVFLRDGQPEPPAAPDVSAQWNVVTPGYFETMGIPVLQGRSFSREDRADAVPVAIVSQSFATRMFGSESPLGKRVRSWRDENLLREIIGVVDEVRYTGLGEREVLRQVYVPHAQNSWGLMNVALRSATETPDGLEAALRREVTALDRDLAVSNVASLRAVARQSVAGERYTTMLLAAFAATAITLGAIGIYGVISHSLLMRRRELGVRAALGASPRHLYRIVIGEGLRVAAIGVVLGVGGALLVSRALDALLYETNPRDPAMFAIVVATVLVVAVLACIGPARRAAAVDPLTELRQA